MAKMRRQTKTKADILIIGGGHAGFSLAAVLGASGLDVVCFERGPDKPRAPDGRTLALSFRSMRVFEKAGVTASIKKNACPILDISASLIRNRHCFSLSIIAMSARNPFGWIIENHLFERALRQRVGRLKNVRMVYDAALLLKHGAR